MKSVQEIMDILGIEGPVTNDKIQAIMEAIGAIIESRIDLSGNDMFNGGMQEVQQDMDIDVEVDPELDKPSKKHDDNLENDLDVEINDPDNLLDGQSQDKSQDEEDQEEQEQQTNEIDQDADENDSEVSADADEEESEEDDFDQDDEDDEDDAEEADDTEEDEDDFNEDDFEDSPSMSNPANNNSNSSISSKENIRRITKARISALANQAINKAPNKPDIQQKTKELQKTLDKLNELTEEELDSMSDEQFGDLINKIIDQISALDPSTYVQKPEEYNKKINEIQKEFSDQKTIDELNQEDSIIVGNERAAIRANEREKNRYTAGNFKSIADFRMNFYKAIKNQVTEIEQQDQSWSVINRRYDGTNRVVRGNKNEILKNELIPTIDIYIDCSGSWDDEDIKVGENILSYVLEFETKKQIKTNLYYFSNHIFSTKEAARQEAGTRAWPLILQNIKDSKTKNVVLITDSDMDTQAKRGDKCLVDGCVWIIWKNGENSQEIVKKLVGKRGNYQYEFKSERSW